MMAMTLIAGVAAVRRVERRYRGIWLDSIISMWASSWIMAVVAVFGVVQVQQAAATSGTTRNTPSPCWA